LFKEVGLEVNVEKTKYMLVSRQQNAGQNQDIQTANSTSEHVSQFRYLGTVTSQNFIQEEIKRRLNSGNACYHSVQNFLSFLLSKDVKIRIHRTIVLPPVLYGCETWSVALREEQGLRVFGNRVLRRIFGLKWDQVAGRWKKNYITRSCMICTLRQA
jgi:hypothetical protein